MTWQVNVNDPRHVLAEFEREIRLSDPDLHRALTTGRLRASRPRVIIASFLLTFAIALVFMTAVSESTVLGVIGLLCLIVGGLMWVNDLADAESPD